MAKGQVRVGGDKSDTVQNLPIACSDEGAAVHFVEQLRWSDSPACPRCASADVYQVKDRKTGARNADFRWRCRGCSQFFTIRTGSVMEESRIPMRHWCWAFWQLCSSKKGISAKQIQRQTGLSYKSALFLMHRVRFAMCDMEGVKLSGTVEADETYVGGKPRNKGPQNKRGRGTKKQPVFGMVERGGRVRTQVVANVTSKTLKCAIREVVDNQARIMTDELSVYRGLGTEFSGGHEVVCHGLGEYARGDAHVNTMESVFALVKRGMYGVYHSVSKRHLHRYLSEFDYRWNTRKMEDGQRTAQAIRSAAGKRLMYREPAA